MKAIPNTKICGELLEDWVINSWVIATFIDKCGGAHNNNPVSIKY